MYLIEEDLLAGGGDTITIEGDDDGGGGEDWYPVDTGAVVYGDEQGWPTGDATALYYGASTGTLRVHTAINVGADGDRDTNVNIYSDTAGAYLKLEAVGGANAVRAHGVELRLQCEADDQIKFFLNGAKRWEFADSGGGYALLPAAQTNIGSTSAELGDIYIGDDKKIKFGDDQDAYIQWNSSSARLELVVP